MRKVGDLERPEAFSLESIKLTEEQDKLLSALIADISAANKLGKLKILTRAQYWVKRIWDTGYQEGAKDVNEKRIRKSEQNAKQARVKKRVD